MKIVSRAVILLAITGIIAAITFIGYQAASPTDPYKISPTSVRAAAENNRSKYSFDPDSRSLTVFSSDDVSVVCDPGESFRHETTWIIELPKDSDHSLLLQYVYTLPGYARADQIRFSNSDLPPDILAAAYSDSWN